MAPGASVSDCANLRASMRAWIGVMVPSGTPRPIVDRLSAAVAQAMKAPDTGEKLAASGLELDYRAPAEFSRYLADQRSRFGEIIRKNNIRIERGATSGSSEAQHPDRVRRCARVRARASKPATAGVARPPCRHLAGRNHLTFNR